MVIPLETEPDLHVLEGLLQRHMLAVACHWDRGTGSSKSWEVGFGEPSWRWTIAVPESVDTRTGSPQAKQLGGSVTHPTVDIWIKVLLSPDCHSKTQFSP